ncbi:MAG TPA: hypothetical protein PLM79_05110 [Syntrophobacteraceae bacterium]|nr:hypothetical protein [Syntrophobacteraceae bacterium]
MTTAPTLPDVSLARRELRELLRGSCILRPGPGQPLRTPDGEPALWLFYSWDATLTRRGMTLAAACLLEALSSFEASQLATVGYTGLPLLLGCILYGKDRYTGLCVRDERKGHGSLRRIEGPGDRSRPVVLIDDSLVSGSSLCGAVEALEGEGFRVEGAVALVNFPWGGGIERLNALGYRVECIFDSVRDLQIDEPLPSTPHLDLLPDSWDHPPIPDGLHPATAARMTMEHYLRTGKVPRPPGRMDSNYDGRGGVFVSLRERETSFRLARDGFYHFDARDSDPCRDVVLAAVATVRGAPELTRETLRTLKIAVSFLGPLRETIPGGLDFPRYGIVVRSKGGERIGGALPNTEYFIGETEQYRHARSVNAQVGDFEPHDLFRHTVTKAVEPGAYWLPFGSSANSQEDWTEKEEIGRRLTLRAREILAALPNGPQPGANPVPDDLIPAPLFSVGVTLFHRGLLGCGLSWGDTLDRCLQQAVEIAYGDERFSGSDRGLQPNNWAVAVSILHDREWLGEASLEEACTRMRRGLDSLSIEYRGGGDMLLPFVCVHENLSKEQMGEALLEKAGNPGPPHHWAVYPTATWMEKDGKVSRVRFGFPDRLGDPYGPDRWREDAALLASYLLGHLGSDGLPEYSYDPITGHRVKEAASPVRPLHALWALVEAGRVLECSQWCRRARRGLELCLEHVREEKGGRWTLGLADYGKDLLADAVLLLALTAAGEDLRTDPKTEALASNLRSLVQPDGRVTEMPEARGMDSDHDIFPAVVLLALGRYAENTGKPFPAQGIEAALDRYARRFRLVHPWAMVGWHPQAWNALHAVSGNPAMAAFAGEVADWALAWQHEENGSFLCDLEPEGYSFHTAFVAEGVADAGRLAARRGDLSGCDRYARSCSRALRFMNQLIIREEDTFCMANPAASLGGVRGAVFLSEVRIDYVSHTLLALVKALEAFPDFP